MEMNLIQRQGLPFAAIPAAGVHGVGARALPRNISLLIRGVNASRRILADFKPDVLLFTGGYVAVPMAFASRKYQTLLYVPDIEPGLALKTLARFADCIALTAEESRRFFSPRVRAVITGYPTRPELGQWDRATARAHLGLHDRLPVLLVSGGSQGARNINQALLPLLPQLLAQAQIVHLTGETTWPDVQAARDTLSPQLSANYHPFPYLHEMGAALAAADLAVTRAGASVLGELPLFGLPAILVPYPYAWRYQRVNADYLVNRGAALLIEDSALSAALVPAIKNLLSRPEQLRAMRQAMQSLSRPAAAQEIAAMLLELAAVRPQKGFGVS